ncbi:hypothetical protein SALBM135S_03025 [Streptomyces alboniger]
MPSAAWPSSTARSRRPWSGLKRSSLMPAWPYAVRKFGRAARFTPSEDTSVRCCPESSASAMPGTRPAVIASIQPLSSGANSRAGTPALPIRA